ncbi:acyl-CoA synthetase (AMP-forming)/AMP-acid ligase II [Anoxybacillus tepidamans]|uniref:Acyl-CoA synthetase (AMP-forming)/AMP-acid ligase II n=1 Tax=Anoxybacteroides tepidamans TaxID=265948 RepID=A0A7W8IT49_9BACL|nr:hypothetical protein [Anoxybacillus tepidamans]MBB5325471.1 acyl-CoA synthetase (AMP-forming)/AMP-acid ligase II [Anoxybacillus tepidamans]
MALLVPNVFNFLSLLLAVNRLGGTVVPINPFLEKEELKNILSLVDPHIIFAVKKYDRCKCFKAVYEWAHSIREETVIFETEDYCHWSTLVIKGSPKAVGEYDADIIDCAYDDEGVLKTAVMDMALIKHMDESLSTVMALSKDDKVFGLASLMSDGLGACLLLTLLKKQLQFVVVESRNWQEVISFIKKNRCNKLLTTLSLFKKLKVFAKHDQNLDLEKLEFIGFIDRMAQSDLFKIKSTSSSAAIMPKMTSIYCLSEDGITMFHVNAHEKIKMKWMLAWRENRWLILPKENR